MELTDNEIKTALKCCFGGREADCENCPNSTTCDEIDVVESIINLIDRRDAEIERLNKEVDRLSQVVLYHDGHIADAKAEAIKEVVERLKENESKDNCQWCNHSNKGRRSDWCNEIIDGHCRCLAFSKFESKLDNLVKETED